MAVEWLRARRLLTEEGWCQAHWLAHDEGRIIAIGPMPASETGFDADLLVPALIDGHVHGGYGVDVMDDDPAALATLSLGKTGEGVGAFVATTVTAPLPVLEQALARVAAAMALGVPGAELLGSYLEGPYFTPTNKGAHDSALFRELDINELERLLAASQGTLKVVALAPEKLQALSIIRQLKQLGVRVMLGHSCADYEMTCAAFAAGADGVVHCFNGMTGLHHREPGMAGAALTHPRAWLELIADGHHIHPAVLRLSHCAAANRLMLITDAMRAAGMPDGTYLLGAQQVEMKEGVVRTREGSLAGSTLGLLEAVRNMVWLAGVPLAQAIHHASLAPARWLGVEERLGSLAVGKQANLLALDDGLRQQAIWIAGRRIEPSQLHSPSIRL